MNTDHKIVMWVHEHMHELEWYEGATGGVVARYNNITIQVSMAGLSIADGLRSCKIKTREVKKLMDTEDYTAKELHDTVMAIRKVAVDQVINRLDNPSETERIKKALFKRLNDGGF